MIRSKSIHRLWIYAVLLCIAVVMLLPVIWVLVTSLKPKSDIFTRPVILFPKTVVLTHYRDLARLFDLPRVIMNSLVISGSIMISTVFFSTMVGYGFAKFKSKLVDLFFLMILAALMVPPFAKLIPLYVLMVKMGLNDTLVGVILPDFLSVFGIFFMRQYTLTVPDELLQAARIDGASELRILLRIVFPVMKSAIFTLAAIKFIWSWNDFLWPLIMLSDPQKMTLSVSLAAFKGNLITVYGPLMAGSIILMVPPFLLFLALQRRIVQGIALSGFKA
ncbi:MAG: carbohydrate ABC transporter permease [Bacteroidetes bacterium]|nr:carbohydrate ABC transporter permease [Bacteroidota bacterium]